MGIHGMRNLFENNEPEPDEDKDFVKNLAGTNPHVMLPPLAEGFQYEIQKLPSGKSAVIVTGEAEVVEEKPKRPPRNPDVCDCARYQSCEKCRFYEGGDLNSPESLTLRHKD